MKKLFLYLFLFFCFTKAFATELQAEFFFEDKVSVVREGDVVTGTLRVWPIENAKSEEFSKFLGKNLFDGLFLSDVISSAPSVNNADVYELKAHFVVVGKIDPEKMVFNYEGNSTHVRYREVLFKPLEEKNNSFYILDQSIDGNYIVAIIALVIIITLGVMIFKFRDKLNNLFKKKPKENPIDIYRKLFMEAKDRKDFEKIYAEKEKWMSLLETRAPAHYDFFKVLNNYQYKKDWAANELSEVQESFDIIRRSFK